MSGPDLVIVDYGMGNLFNVRIMFEDLGASCLISNKKKDIQGASHLVLPGVGAFASGMENLRKHGLAEEIVRYAGDGRPFLGICLGMQLLMTESEEHGKHEGLNLIPGRVVRFREPEPDGPRHKIPQVGWNSLRSPSGNGWQDSVLSGLAQNACLYFIHSYRVVPDDSAHVLALTTYGRDEFCSVLQAGNIGGCQFHPERSGPAGRMILESFLAQ